MNDDDYETELALLERKAQHFLTLYRQPASPEPSIAEENDRIRPLVDNLRTALDYNSRDDLNTILENQARTLDIAFRRLMSDADTTYKDAQNCEAKLAFYAGAFKAQDLFRRTAMSLNLLKRWKKRKKTEQTNYKRTIKET